MPVGGSVENDLVGLLENCRIVVGRHPTDHHDVAPGDPPPSQLHVPGRRAGEGLTRAVEPEKLLNGSRHQSRVGEEPVPGIGHRTQMV